MGATDPDHRQRFVAGIVARYGGRLRRFLKLKTSNAADVPDLAQEVFMRLMRVQDHDEIRSPEAYLFTVASHVVQQHSQKRAAMPETLEISEVFADLDLISRDDPTVHMEIRQRLRELERVLGQLPPRVAMTLLLHRFAGNSIEEIAAELGIARITVKKYLARALVHCREHCVDTHRDPS